MQLQLL